MHEQTAAGYDAVAGEQARYLSDLGREIIGVDLSLAMIAEARALNADLDIRQGDLCALDLSSGEFAGVVAFYSIIHPEPGQLQEAAREMHRILLPCGQAAIAADCRRTPAEAA